MPSCLLNLVLLASLNTSGAVWFMRPRNIAYAPHNKGDYYKCYFPTAACNLWCLQNTKCALTVVDRFECCKIFNTASGHFLYSAYSDHVVSIHVKTNEVPQYNSANCKGVMTEVNRNVLEITSGGDRKKICVVALPEIVIAAEYSFEISMRLDYVNSCISGTLGIAYNMQNLSNYDFIHFRTEPGSIGDCYESGYVMNGHVFLHGSKRGDCLAENGGKLYYDRFYRIKVLVSSTMQATIWLDGVELVTVQTVFMHTGSVGIVSRNACFARIRWKFDSITNQKNFFPGGPYKIMRRPEDVIAVVGSAITLSCESSLDNDTIYWLFYRDAPQGQHLNGPLVENVTVTRYEFGKQLTIRHSRLEDAGLYRCILKETNKQTLAQVTLLVSPPMCGNHLNTTHAPLDTHIRLSCEVQFSGDWQPTMKWITGQRDDALIAHSRTTVGPRATTIVSSYIDFLLQPSSFAQRIACIITFEEKQSGSADLVLAYRHEHVFRKIVAKVPRLNNLTRLPRYHKEMSPVAAVGLVKEKQKEKDKESANKTDIAPVWAMAKQDFAKPLPAIFKETKFADLDLSVGSDILFVLVGILSVFAIVSAIGGVLWWNAKDSMAARRRCAMKRRSMSSLFTEDSQDVTDSDSFTQNKRRRRSYSPSVDDSMTSAYHTRKRSTSSRRSSGHRRGRSHSRSKHRRHAGNYYY